MGAGARAAAAVVTVAAIEVAVFPEFSWWQPEINRPPSIAVVTVKIVAVEFCPSFQDNVFKWSTQYQSKNPHTAWYGRGMSAKHV